LTKKSPAVTFNPQSESKIDRVMRLKEILTQCTDSQDPVNFNESRAIKLLDKLSGVRNYYRYDII